MTIIFFSLLILGFLTVPLLLAVLILVYLFPNDDINKN